MKAHLVLAAALFVAQQQGAVFATSLDDSDDSGEDWWGDDVSDSDDYDSTSHVVRLTGDNFYEKSRNKRVFVDFYDPMWGHCLLMADDWSELATGYAESNLKGDEEILIGKMDCTQPDNKSICQTYGIKSYPSLMYGDIVDLLEFPGQRTLEAWRELVMDHLKNPAKLCSVANTDACDADKKKHISDMMNRGATYIDLQIEEVEDRLGAIDYAQKTMVKKLQDRYKDRNEQKEADKLKLLKESSGLKWMKAILQMKMDAANGGEL